MNALSNVAIGLSAESDACDYLQKHGLKLIEQNFCAKGGEIDLIMKDDAYTVFVEVKMRSAKAYGSVLEMVDRKKRGRIIHAAKLYLMKRGEYYRTLCRFDVIGIEPHPTIANEQKITWIKNAFQEM